MSTDKTHERRSSQDRPSSEQKHGDHSLPTESLRDLMRRVTEQAKREIAGAFEKEHGSSHGSS